jgi:signal transduction histidine kinase
VRVAGAGTGLELATVNACVGRHGGTVELEAAPEGRATVTLWFPAVLPEG